MMSGLRSLSASWLPWRGSSTAMGALGRATVLRITRKALTAAGWEVVAGGEFDRIECLRIRRGALDLLTYCSGCDRRLTGTVINDLRPVAASRGMHLMFVHGEQLDPRVRGHVVPGKDILIASDDLDALDGRIDGLAPAMIGAVDCIESPRELSGWARLSPRGHAHLQAWRDQEMLGECVADIYRDDLLHVGDGYHAFRLPLREECDPQATLARIRIKAFHAGTYIGLLPYWDKIVIRS